MSVDTPRGSLRITVSIGISSFEGGSKRDRDTVQSLLERADANLYASKARGRNRVSASTTLKPRVKSSFGPISDEKASFRSVR